MTFVVAIDGPAGTGKSSVAKSLAKTFDFIYVDTGALYRALAYVVEKYHKDPNIAADVLPLVSLISLVVDEKNHCTAVEFEQKILRDELRTETMSRLSSVVSQHQDVRKALLPIQREVVNIILGGAIFEGRDIGTVVFPYAPLKIFITANSETRARRRYEELQQKNSPESYEEVFSAIQKRDDRDAKRTTAPLQAAPDAHLIDSSSLTLQEVIEEAKKLVLSAQKNYKIGQKLW
jgi:cytidylate kinase